MLVADRRQVDGDRPTRWLLLALIAKDEAPPDVEVAVEPEAFVERATGRRVLPPERQGVAFDGVDVTGGRIVKAPKVVGDDPPAAGDADGRVLEGMNERADDVACRLDARVEDDDDRSDRAAEPGVERRRLTEPL
jgi:hypothetical protein